MSECRSIGRKSDRLALVTKTQNCGNNYFFAVIGLEHCVINRLTPIRIGTQPVAERRVAPYAPRVCESSPD